MPKDLRGSLRINQRKTAGSNQPDFKGLCNVGGAEYWISGWEQTGSEGENYISLAFEPKEEAAKPPAKPNQALSMIEKLRAAKTTGKRVEDLDDDFPT